MKIAFIVYAAILVIAGCTSKKELGNEEALMLIKEKQQYPKAVDYDIFCSDPGFAKKVLDAKLEEIGLVTVQRTQQLRDVGKPLIHFTDKAEPFFLPTPEKDKSSNIQRVKLADEDLMEVTNITTDESGNKAIVEYTTGYKNITPFSALVSLDFKTNKTRKANFSLNNDDSWKVE